MARDTESRVIGAASQLFAERGYLATTTRAIADRAGVNEVTLFRRFDSKLGILRAIAATWAETSAGFAAERSADPADTRTTLQDLARMEVAAARESGGAAMRLAFEATSVPEVAELIGDAPRRNMEGLAAYMRQRQQAGDLRGDISAEALAEAFFSLTSSYVMYRMVLGSVEMPAGDGADPRLGELMELFWRGARS